MKKVISVRMEETTARKLKMAALIANQPAGDFLAGLVEAWARERGLSFVLRDEVLRRSD